MNPTSSSIKWLLYLCCVTIAAFSIYHLCTQNQSYWLILSALFLSLITIGDTFSERVFNIAIAGVCLTIIVFLAGVAAWNMLAIAIFLFLVTLFSFYLIAKNSDYFIMALIIALFAILSGGMLLSFSENLDRGFFILFGTAIAAFFQVIFLHHFVQNEIHTSLMMTLHQLALLNTEIFDCFLQKDYKENVYLYERRLHIQKNKYLNAISKFRDICKTINKKSNEKYLDEIYQIMLEYSMLRWRVSDHTIFSLAIPELTNIKKEINFLLYETRKKLTDKKIILDIDKFTTAIKQFEALFQNVLQVTAKEPLVFILFVASLKNLVEKFSEINER